MAGGRRGVALLWLRRGDLRVADNEALTAAANSGAAHVLPVFCLDPAELRPRQPVGEGSALGVPQMGPHRLRLLQQAILGLHDSLQQLGSGLAFRVGAPQQQLPALLHEVAPQLALAQDAQDSASSGARGHVELLYHMLPLLDSAEAEARVEAAVAAAAAQLGWTCSVRRFWGTTLYHPDDLPYAAFAAAAASRAEEQQQKQQQAATQQAPAGASRGQAGRPNASPAHFASLPDVMTTFRKLSQQHAAVRQPLPAPSSLPPLPPGLAQTSLAGSMDRDVRALYAAAGAEEALLQLQRLTSVDAAALPCSTSQAGGAGGSSDSSRSVADPRSAFPWEVSEAGALRRLRHYLWGDEAGAAGAGADAAPALAYFTETRMQAVGVDNSTKLSPFLALGCISPRQVHAEVLQLLQGDTPADSGAAAADGHWLIMHLCIRDFFIYSAMKAARSLHTTAGIQGTPTPWGQDPALLQRWAQGRTGLPFVDACMRELAHTGWMSNRGRQNVASLLAKSLQLDWTAGADLFGCLLLDCEPAVNWANWAYFAGVGNDPRNRVFKTVTQGEQYDEAAELVRMWVPELAALPPAARHRPWNLTGDEALAAGYVHGVTYPEAVVDVSSQIGVGPSPSPGGKGGKGRQRKQAAAMAAQQRSSA